MATNKRYYWIKLKEEFFTDKRIKRLRRISGGDTYTIIYLKLLLLSLKDEGKLYYDGVESDFIKELALTIDETDDDVMVTVNYLINKGLLEVVTENEGIFPTMKPVGQNVSSNSENTKAKKLDLSKVKVEPLFEDFVDFDKFSESDFRVVKVKKCEEVPKSKKLLKFTLNDGSGKDRIILSGIKNYHSAEDLVGKTLLAITNLPPRKMMGEDSCGMLLSAICEYEGEEVLNLIMLDENIPAGSKIY